MPLPVKPRSPVFGKTILRERQPGPAFLFRSGRGRPGLRRGAGIRHPGQTSSPRGITSNATFESRPPTECITLDALRGRT